MMREGMTYEAFAKVSQENTAQQMGSGGLRVYATPALVALMESAAYQLAQGELEEGKTSVGIEMNVKHMAATPVGMEVHAKATLTKIDGKKLYFSIEAFDEKVQIGSAEHIRYVVDGESFQKRADEKRNG